MIRKIITKFRNNILNAWIDISRIQEVTIKYKTKINSFEIDYYYPSITFKNGMTSDFEFSIKSDTYEKMVNIIDLMLAQ
jgi:hypothetical protein